MKRLITVSTLMLFLWPISSTAETNWEKGLAIAKEADRRGNGYVDFKASLHMILQNRQGNVSSRDMHIRTLEVKNNGDKNLIIFDSPKDLKGTAFLTYTYKIEDDDQWLYLPALKRVKRISSRNKSGSFMGSEFAYEDIASQEVEKYEYSWVRDEIYEGLECFVIERYPVDKKNSGYTRLLTWIDKSEYRVQKIDYYDRKETLLKTLSMKKYKKYQDRFWRAHEMTMVNHQNGKSTMLTWSNFRFKTGLRNSDFDNNRLNRVR